VFAGGHSESTKLHYTKKLVSLQNNDSKSCDDGEMRYRGLEIRDNLDPKELLAAMDYDK